MDVTKSRHHERAELIGSDCVFFAGTFDDIGEHDTNMVLVGAFRAARDVFADVRSVFAAEFVVQVLFELAARGLASTVGHDASPFGVTMMPCSRA